MDSSPKMDVIDWQDSPPPVIPTPRAPRRFLPPTLIGILGTLLLHALVIQTVPWGTDHDEWRDARGLHVSNSAGINGV
jgi:hypothetical protein